MSQIITSEIGWYLTTASGAAGNTTAGAAATSLGKYLSTTAFVDLATLFDDISGAENAANTVDYRCLAIRNSNSANAYANVVLYISSEVAGGASIAIAADSTAASAIGSSTAQALTGASETAPGGSVTGLTYSSPTTAGAGVSLGSIPVGNCKMFWIRRTAANSAALGADGCTLATSGESGSL